MTHSSKAVPYSFIIATESGSISSEVKIPGNNAGKIPLDASQSYEITLHKSRRRCSAP